MNPLLKLLVVMIVTPAVMNAFQLWVTDNFLKLGREDEVFARGTASLLVGAEGVPWTVEMVLALEHIIMDKDKEKFKRVMAWYKLIKLWGALRSHDTEAIPPSTIKYEEPHGLEAQIMRTKTTGAGRKVEVVHLFIYSQAWLSYRGWLVEGLRIYKSMDDDQRFAARDFLMCLPTVDLQSFRKTMMRYPDAMVFLRTLFTELLAQRKNEFGNYERLMEPASSSFWSEHSERVTIISWASACGIDKETRKRWGRWSPSVDEDYVTTTRQLIFAAQRKIAGYIREQYGVKDVVDDQGILNTFALWLQ
eukprot:g13850.t1